MGLPLGDGARGARAARDAARAVGPGDGSPRISRRRQKLRRAAAAARAARSGERMKDDSLFYLCLRRHPLFCLGLCVKRPPHARFQVDSFASDVLHGPAGVAYILPAADAGLSANTTIIDDVTGEIVCAAGSLHGVRSVRSLTLTCNVTVSPGSRSARPRRRTQRRPPRPARTRICRRCARRAALRAAGSSSSTFEMLPLAPLPPRRLTTARFGCGFLMERWPRGAALRRAARASRTTARAATLRGTARPTR